MRTSTISKTEMYSNKIYDETVKSELGKEILLELQVYPKPQRSNLHS